ncbi:MAG: M24 family metallopeptidase [Gammaproteobacteria bacterium]
MSEPQLHFTREEFAGRRARVLAAMAARQLDGLLIFRQESMYYLTGFDSFGYVFFQCLYLRGDGRMTLLTRAPDLRQARLTSVIEDIRIWKDAPDARPAEELRAIVREQGGARFGAEWDGYGLTAKNGRLVAEAFSDVALEDASLLVSELRAVKSGAEINYVRRAAKLADKAMAQAESLAAPGADEGEILAAMQGAVFAGGGDYSGNEFIIGSGERALLCRSFSGRRRLSARDQLTVEFAGVYRRYHAALMKTILTGEPSARHLQMREVCEEARARAAEALRPGAALGEVFAGYARAADSAGMQKHRLNATGYSLGALFAPSWMDWPMIYEGSRFIVKPDMVFFIHIILMDSDAGAAMTAGETYLTGENGAIPLSGGA